MDNNMIPFDQCEVPAEDYLKLDIIQHDVSTASNMVTSFEHEILKFMHVDGKDIDAIAVNSGTSALFLALKAHDIGKGDFVVIPDITYIATANAVLMTGALPVIMAINKEDWMLDLKNYEVLNRIFTFSSYHKGKTVVLPVDLYGGVVTYNQKTLDTLHQHGIGVVYDSAESFGAILDDSYLHCYSFNGNKIMTTGGGGAVIGRKSLIDKIRDMIKPREYDGLAYNYGMPGLNAALGMAQMENLYRVMGKKWAIAERYYEAFVNSEHIQLQNHIQSNDWYFPIKFKNKDIALRVKEVFNRVDPKIPYRDIFKPISMYAHMGCAYQYLDKFSRVLYLDGLCLPVSTRLTLYQREHIIEAIQLAIGVMQC